MTRVVITWANMSTDDEDEIPELVPAEVVKVPITVITGFLGNSTYMYIYNDYKELR